jgi:hypothetical protein
VFDVFIFPVFPPDGASIQDVIGKCVMDTSSSAGLHLVD